MVRAGRPETGTGSRRKALRRVHQRRCGRAGAPGAAGRL